MRAALCAAVLVATGCDQLFALSHVDEPPGSDACDPLPYDANRYRFLAGRGLGLGWSGGDLGSREICAAFAMDLIVLDEGDTDELLQQSAGAPTPFWLGVAYVDGWKAIDGCTPHLAWAPGEPASEAAGQCVIVTEAGMATWPCNHQPSEQGEHIQGLCETPRPSVECRQAASEYAVASTTAIARTDAIDACRALGMELVDINSTAELDELVQQFPDVLDFWLGATWSGTKWMTGSGCPLVLPWRTNEPDIVAGEPRCAVADATGGRTRGCSGLGTAICERN